MDGNSGGMEGLSSIAALRLEEQLQTAELDRMYGYNHPDELNFICYVINFHQGTYINDDNKLLCSCLDLYCVKEDGTRYKIQEVVNFYFVNSSLQFSTIIFSSIIIGSSF